MLDNSGIDYSRILLFMFFLFFFIGKLNQILAPPATAGLRLDYKVVASKLSKKQNVTSKTTGFITINNISTPFCNWKIAAILFVNVIDYYLCIIIQ